MTLARFAVLAAAVGLAIVLLAPAAARAQQTHPGEDIERVPVGEEHHHDVGVDETPVVQLPWRILATLGAGATLRLVVDPALRETLFAPPYLEARGGVVFPGSGTLRHGALLGIATNLTGDGPTGTSSMPMGSLALHAFRQGLNAATQWVLTPSYMAYFRLSEDFVATARFGIPFAVSPYTTLGFELGGSLAWMITAGFGIFVEANLDVWLGEDVFPYPTVSGGLGVVIDYEVLP